jgi:N-acyl amino acid synthase of PEP-CTERM/exosortase system
VIFYHPKMSELFTFRKIEGPELLAEAYRLRFQVYCRECHFIKESDYSDGIETDGFDKYSLHFGGFDSQGALVGTVRLILSSCAEFPIEEHCPSLNIDRDLIKRPECAEISRLTISKLFRRRTDDGLYYGPQVADQQVEDKGAVFIRRVRPMAFGLYRAMYQESKRIGVRHWYALMEKSLWLLLKIHGFVFTPIGPEVDFYGMVTPYIVGLSDLEKNVHAKFPQFFAYFMEGLEPEFQPNFK